MIIEGLTIEESVEGTEKAVAGFREKPKIQGPYTLYVRISLRSLLALDVLRAPFSLC
jgi:hypothetical protein